MATTPLSATTGPETFTLTTKSKQTIEGFGSSTAWYADEFWDFKPEERDGMLRHLFDKESGMGFSIHRVRIDPTPGENPDGPIYDWKNETLVKQGQLIRLIQDRYNPVIMAAPWTPPSWMKDNGETKNGGRLKEEFRKSYAEYLAHWVHGMKENFGVEIDILSLQNEPEEGKKWESCVWTAEELAEFLAKDLGPAMAEKGLKTGILATELTKWDDKELNIILDHPVAGKLITHTGAHLYHGSHKRQRPFAKAQERGLPVWMTEFYFGNYLSKEKFDETERGLNIATAVHDNFVKAESNAFLFWWSISGPDKHAEGLITANFSKDLTPPFAGWKPKEQSFFMAQFSRFIQPGDIRHEVVSEINENTALVSAYRKKDGSHIVVAINREKEEKLISLKVEGASVPKKWEMHRTSEQERLDEVGLAHASIDNVIYTTLAPRSVTTFRELAE